MRLLHSERVGLSHGSCCTRCTGMRLCDPATNSCTGNYALPQIPTRVNDAQAIAPHLNCQHFATMRHRATEVHLLLAGTLRDLDEDIVA